MHIIVFQLNLPFDTHVYMNNMLFITCHKITAKTNCQYILERLRCNAYNVCECFRGHTHSMDACVTGEKPISMLSTKQISTSNSHQRIRSQLCHETINEYIVEDHIYAYSHGQYYVSYRNRSKVYEFRYCRMIFELLSIYHITY